MSIDTLITDVQGKDYIVLIAADGIVYAPCHYNPSTDVATYDPTQTVMLVTIKSMQPLAKHESAIRKLIAINLKIQIKLDDPILTN